jgi:hypothetical protein
MKRKILYIIIGVTALSLHSCFKDKGNYDYLELTPVTIDLGNNGFLDAKRSETLQITPKLFYSGDTVSADNPKAGNDFSFVWYCNDEEIATTPVLDYPVKDLKGHRPYVKLKLANNSDGTIFLKGFYVSIIAEFQTGWITLTKQDGRSIISYINPDSYEIIPDFYTSFTGEELGPNAIEIKEHWSQDLAGIPGNVLVIRNDPDGNIDLDGSDLSPMYNTNNFFVGNLLPADFRPKSEIYLWNYSFMLDDNGNVYARKYENNRLLQSGVYTNSPYFVGDTKFDRIGPDKFMTDMGIFYDGAKGCLYLALGNSGRVLPLVITGAMGMMPTDYTKTDAMDKKLAYIGNLRQGKGTSTYFLIYKDDDGQYWRQMIQVMDQMMTCMAMLYVDMIPNPMGPPEWMSDLVIGGTENINDETIFCMLERTFGSGQMFYSGGAGNRTLYYYHVPSNASTEYYTFDSPIKTISDNLIFLPPTTHTLLMVGLENGEFHFIGITPDDHTGAKADRHKKTVTLGQGVPISGIYKQGWGYTNMQ